MMIKDFSLFSWRIGLVLIIAMPLLYITSWAASFLLGGGHPVEQFILSATVVIPPVFLSIAVGAILCLLVRIEMHLRVDRKDS